MVFTGAGYFMGIHAPGRKGLNNFLSAAHHAAMCQAEGGRIVRSINSNCKVGTTFSCSDIHAASTSRRDVLAANRVDALLNRLFIEPLTGKGYPVDDLKLLQRLEPFIKDGDERKLAFDMDFIGVQNYTREVVAYSYTTPLLWANIVHANKRKVDTTLMGWEVYPECMYNVLQKFNKYKRIKELIVTENGAAFTDVLMHDTVHDEKRTAYLQQHIAQVARARKDGVNVNGYFVWSFTDNFEWAEGYRPGFGLVHVDFSTQKRTIKSSGYWYSELLKSFSSNHHLRKAI
jgi:beta-glucosidase